MAEMEGLQIPDWLTVLILLIGFPGMIVLGQHIWRNVGSYRATTLTDRGKALIAENVPLVDSLSENRKQLLFEQISRLRKTCNFRMRHATSAQSDVLIEMANDDQAILLCHMAFLTLGRSAPFPVQLFPIAVTGNIPLQSEPIIQGRPGTVYPRIVSREDIALDRVLNTLGLSPFIFQIAKFIQNPDLKAATAVHRAEYNKAVLELDQAYKEIVVEPAEELASVSGEPETIPSPYTYLLEQQKKFFGSFAEYQSIDARIRIFLDAFYGQRQQLH